MGILNLHKFLERASSKNNLASLRGSVVGVDAMCWLHRGSIASAWELLTGRDTDKFLRFFIKMLVLCNMNGVKPIIVFDGASLPAKAKEEETRRERRRENSKKAKEEIESRKISSFGQVDNKLRSMIVQSVTITPEMITRTMSVLRRLNVDFIVAPYEADAQLAYMYQAGIVCGVVSEDSDLLAFGCRRLFTKMDVNGDFTDIRLDWAFTGSESPGKPPDLGELGKLEKWTQSMFTDLCILSGSDYKLGKIAGIGIKKAFQLMNRFRSMLRIIESIARARNWSSAETQLYFEEYKYSKTAFTFHRVFDLETFLCVTFSDSHESVEPTDEILGPEIPPSIAKKIMFGEIDAKTKETRTFLSKLPPGVLGLYNNSLRQTSSDIEKFSEKPLQLVDTSAQESLEAQIVAEFSRYKVNDAQASKMNAQYLDSLRGMILKQKAPPGPAAIEYIVEDHEFDDIENLLQLDERETSGNPSEDENDGGGDNQHDAEEEDNSVYSPLISPRKNLDRRIFLLGSASPKKQAQQIESPTQSLPPPKKINPFAKKGTDGVKQSVPSTVGTVTVAPHLMKLQPQANGLSDFAQVLKRKQIEAAQSAAPTKNQKLVTSREVPTKQPSNFFRRRN